MNSVASSLSVWRLNRSFSSGFQLWPWRFHPAPPVNPRDVVGRRCFRRFLERPCLKEGRGVASFPGIPRTRYRKLRNLSHFPLVLSVVRLSDCNGLPAFPYIAASFFGYRWQSSECWYRLGGLDCGVPRSPGLSCGVPNWGSFWFVQFREFPMVYDALLLRTLKGQLRPARVDLGSWRCPDVSRNPGGS